MKMKLFLLFFGLLGFVVQAAANEKIYVNSEVTTHIVMPENIKLVDISTTRDYGQPVCRQHGTHQALSGARLHQNLL